METSLLLPYLEQIKSLAALLVHKGWAEKNAGNFSIRIDTIPQEMLSLFSKEEVAIETRFPSLIHQVFLVKAKGANFRDIAVDPSSWCGLLKLASNGKSYRYLSLNKNKPLFTPTSEIISHLFLQEYLVTNKPSTYAILHTHPLELIIFSHWMKGKTETELNKILASMHVEIPMLIPEGIGFVPYQEPGSIELAESSLQSLKQHSILVWERHGCLAVAKNILEAFDFMDIINKAASIYFGLRSSGFEEESN